MPDVSEASAILPGEKLPERLLWRGDDLPANAGRLALPAAVAEELDRIAAPLDRDPLPLLLLRPEDFRLDASRAFMRTVKQSLNEGPGFAIVDHLPVECWSQSRARAVWWLLASLVARPAARKWDGTSIYDGCDPARPPAPAQPPPVPTPQQHFHTANTYTH